MMQDNTRLWKLISFCAVVALNGCDSPDPSAGDASEGIVQDIIQRLQDARAVEDDAFAAALRADIEALGDDETELLIAELEADLSDEPEFRSSAYIKTSWNYAWPSGIFAGYVGTTTQCGGDVDLRMVFYGVPNAYSNPGNLVLTTNNPYVWGVLKYHGKVLAYNITSNNTVNICIGLGSLSDDVQGVFKHNAWLKY